MKFGKYLKEMPWINFGGKIFDLEIEKTADNHRQLISLLQDILTGKRLKDKYGQVIQLKSQSEKDTFIQALKNDNILKGFLKHTYKDIKNDFEKIVKVK